MSSKIKMIVKSKGSRSVGIAFEVEKAFHKNLLISSENPLRGCGYWGEMTAVKGWWCCPDCHSDLGGETREQCREGSEVQGLPCPLPPASSPLAMLSTLYAKVSLSEYKTGKN